MGIHGIHGNPWESMHHVELINLCDRGMEQILKQRKDAAARAVHAVRALVDHSGY